MDLIKWDDQLSVHVAEIDEQHRKLIGMINNFYETIRDKKKAALGDLLNSLVDYTMYHFSTEEKYMDKFRYRDTEAHKKEHKLFTEKVLEVKKRFDDGRLVITFEVTNFIKDWIVKHVMGTDKRYSGCFNDNGLR